MKIKPKTPIQDDLDSLILLNKFCVLVIALVIDTYVSTTVFPISKRVCTSSIFWCAISFLSQSNEMCLLTGYVTYTLTALPPACL